MLRNDNIDEMYYDKNNYVKLFYLIIKKWTYNRVTHPFQPT